jgi:hypothetical protein
VATGHARTAPAGTDAARVRRSVGVAQVAFGREFVGRFPPVILVVSSWPDDPARQLQEGPRSTEGLPGDDPVLV